MKRLFLSAALLLSAPAFAQQNQQVSANDIQELLRRLDRIQEQQDIVTRNAVNDALRKLEAAAVGGPSAVGLYEDAVKATQYEGKKDDTKNFEEWRFKQRAENRSAPMQTAIQTHLRYLALALKWGNAGEKDRVALLPQVKAYLKILADAERTFGRALLNAEGKKLIDQPIAKSPFVTWLNLEPLLPPAVAWEPVPGNFEGILDKTLRPQLRKMKSPELLELWTQQINLESARADNRQLELEKDKFQAVRLPQLRWSRAEDAILLGYTRTGYGEMLTIIETNPRHSDYAKWVKALSALLSQAATPPPPPPAPAAENQTPAVPAPPAPPASTPPVLPPSPVAPAVAPPAPIPSPSATPTSAASAPVPAAPVASPESAVSVPTPVNPAPVASSSPTIPLLSDATPSASAAPPIAPSPSPSPTPHVDKL